jgi:hypothetical protein
MLRSLIDQAVQPHRAHMHARGSLGLVAKHAGARGRAL